MGHFEFIQLWSRTWLTFSPRGRCKVLCTCQVDAWEQGRQLYESLAWVGWVSCWGEHQPLALGCSLGPNIITLLVSLDMEQDRRTLKLEINLLILVNICQRLFGLSYSAGLRERRCDGVSVKGCMLKFVLRMWPFFTGNYCTWLDIGICANNSLGPVFSSPC